MYRSLLHPIERAFSIPLVAAIGASIVVHGAGAIAAALQSAVLLGIGGLVLGGAAALLSDKLEAPFKAAVTHVQKVLARAARPLAQPLRRAITEIAHVIGDMEPTWNRLFRAAAPIIPLLVETFAVFAEKILPTVVQMMPSVVAMFEVLAARAPELADAVSDLLLAMAKPETIEAFGYLLTGLIGTIRFGSAALGFLTRAFNTAIRHAKTAAAGIALATSVIRAGVRNIPTRWVTRYLFSPGAAISGILRVTGLTRRIPRACFKSQGVP